MFAMYHVELVLQLKIQTAMVNPQRCTHLPDSHGAVRVLYSQLTLLQRHSQQVLDRQRIV